MNKSIVLLAALLLTGCASLQHDIGAISSAEYMGMQCVQLGHVKDTPEWRDCTMQLLGAYNSPSAIAKRQADAAFIQNQQTQHQLQQMQMQQQQDAWNRRMGR